MNKIFIFFIIIIAVSVIAMTISKKSAIVAAIGGLIACVNPSTRNPNRVYIPPIYEYEFNTSENEIRGYFRDIIKPEYKFAYGVGCPFAKIPGMPLNRWDYGYTDPDNAGIFPGSNCGIRHAKDTTGSHIDKFYYFIDIPGFPNPTRLKKCLEVDGYEEIVSGTDFKDRTIVYFEFNGPTHYNLNPFEKKGNIKKIITQFAKSFYHSFIKRKIAAKNREMMLEIPHFVTLRIDPSAESKTRDEIYKYYLAYRLNAEIVKLGDVSPDKYKFILEKYRGGPDSKVAEFEQLNLGIFVLAEYYNNYVAEHLKPIGNHMDVVANLSPNTRRYQKKKFRDYVEYVEHMLAETEAAAHKIAQAYRNFKNIKKQIADYKAAEEKNAKLKAAKTKYIPPLPPLPPPLPEAPKPITEQYFDICIRDSEHIDELLDTFADFNETGDGPGLQRTKDEMKLAVIRQIENILLYHLSHKVNDGSGIEIKYNAFYKPHNIPLNHFLVLPTPAPEPAEPEPAPAAPEPVPAPAAPAAPALPNPAPAPGQ